MNIKDFIFECAREKLKVKFLIKEEDTKSGKRCNISIILKLGWKEFIINDGERNYDYNDEDFNNVLELEKEYFIHRFKKGLSIKVKKEELIIKNQNKIKELPTFIRDNQLKKILDFLNIRPNHDLLINLAVKQTKNRHAKPETTNYNVEKTAKMLRRKIGKGFVISATRTLLLH